MNPTENYLSHFESISLSEMDNVKLMDRMDSKYAFHPSQLEQFLNQGRNAYRVLKVKDFRICNYESLYFDTHDFKLYRNHHIGKMNRYKIRFRKYVESDICFLEIKFKNNKGRTIKNRIKQENISDQLEEEAVLFLKEHINEYPISLEPKMWIDFSRVTLVNKNYPERVTIDLNLRFRNNKSDRLIDNIVITEVKQDKAVRSEWVRMMKDHHIREGTLSKYCMGVTLLFNGQKHNNFKPILIQFNKLHHGIITGNQPGNGLWL